MGTLAWDEIAARFHGAQNWWVVTTGEAGPHAVPVWGVVVGDVPWFYGAATATRSRNLAGDPRLVLHLESASEVLLLHASAAAAGPAGSDPAVNAAYAAKYTEPSDLQHLPDAPANSGSLLYAVTPTRALAWTLGGTGEWDDRRWRAG